MRKTVVINMISGPGSGKSTAMAGLFFYLKKQGVNCELVTEFVKDLVWDESFKTMEDQIYIFANQLHKIVRLNGKVDFIITDGSLLNSILYNKDNSETFNSLVLEQFNKFKNLNFFIKRKNEYQTYGRVESFEEAVKEDERYIDIMNKHDIKFIKLNNSDAADTILNLLKKWNYLS